jgi:MerR family transcriptional regulator, thiopeptide resistance regulator
MNRTYQAHEFAQRAGVTVRALHHYDRLGLLKPSGRTAAGYRVCSDRDLVRLEQIVALKFIGFSLSQIRDLLYRKDLDPSATLRQQRQSLGEKRDHLDQAIRAIERAEEAVASGQKPDWEPFRKIIEVIQMQTRKGWMKKYFTEEQVADIGKRWSPEMKAESDRGWAALARDTEAAITQGEDPCGKVGQQLAVRQNELVEQFTGGNPGMRESLRKLYADHANWPESFKKPFSDAVDTFLRQAAKELARTK